MKFLVASLRAELLPLAHRLRREGHEVQAMVWRARYEKAWGGSIEKIAKHSDGTVMAEALRPQIEAAEAGDLVVLTTVTRVAELFHQARRLYGPGPRTEVLPSDRLLCGGWFDGEQVLAPHLLVADWGCWTGGLGPHLLGGLTLLRIDRVPEFIAGALLAVTERLKSESFRGLFHFDVEEKPETGELRLRGLSAGWPEIHSQVFVAELEGLGEVFRDEAPRLGRRFVSVLPISIPPWPFEQTRGEEGGQRVAGLTVQQQGKLFWFDVEIDHQARQLRSAGLDGFLAVATGSSDSTPALARARALELAHRLTIPGKQYRLDMGGLVDSVLSTLEDRYGFVV